MIAKDIGRSLSAHLDQERLATELRQTLRQTLFSSGLCISPRRVNEVGQEAAAVFFKFLETEDAEAARTYGRDLALEGLGHRSILTMSEALRRACWMANLDREVLRVALGASGRYVNAFLEGYMSGREEEILKEQERTRHAFQRVLEKQARS
jgi:hypothetical protein